jgi:hypothetical protein
MVRYFVFIREPGQLDLICHDQARAGLDFDRHSHAGSGGICLAPTNNFRQSAT